MMKITIVCGDPDTRVALKNVKLDGTPLIPYDDFVVAYSTGKKIGQSKGSISKMALY